MIFIDIGIDVDDIEIDKKRYLYLFFKNVCIFFKIIIVLEV